jgi:chemotaxis regulatin CheY-phosphate phosphatase CheZ
MSTSPARVDFSVVMHKLDEMRSFFVIGQRSIPLLEDLLQFVGDISPLLNDISTSLSFSTSRMPSAATQLEKVTAATELATTEILNLVDRVSEHVSVASLAEQSARDYREQLRERDARFLQSLGAAADAPAVREALASWKSEGDELVGKWEATSQEQKSSLDSVRNDLNQIMMSLQVQDITAQQIASVNHLIESIRIRLSEISERVSNDMVAPTQAETMQEIRDEQSRFDPMARFDPNGNHQNVADDLISRAESGEDVTAGIDPARLDAVLHGGQTFDLDAPAPSSGDGYDGGYSFDVPGGDGQGRAFDPSAFADSFDSDEAFDPNTFADGFDAPAKPQPKPEDKKAPAAAPAGFDDGGFASADDIDALFG